MIEDLSIQLADVLAEEDQGEPIEAVKLPADELAHRQPIEWWYFTGHLQSTDGTKQEFAFEMTAVRLGIGGIAILDYVYFAFIELKAQRYLAAERYSDAAYEPQSDLLGFRFAAPIAQPGEWTIKATSADPPGYSLEAAFEVGNEQRALRLDLGSSVAGASFAATEARVLQGNNGIVQFLGSTMGYYTRPRLPIAGGVKINGELLEVEGSGWLDHEWGPANFVNRRWKFFAIQKIGSPSQDLIVYQVRARDGTQGDPAVGILVDAMGYQKALAPPTITQHNSPSGDGPLWGVGYPLWNTIDVVIDGMPRTFEVEPAFEDQRRVPTGQLAVPLLTWWEGACWVKENGAVYGRAFMELGGYE